MMRIDRLALAATALLAAQGAIAADAGYRFGEGWQLRGAQDRWALRLGARLQYDGARFQQDVTTLGDDTLLRRARAALGIDLGRHFSLLADYDAGDFSPGWKNLWLQYEFSRSWSLRVGSQMAPFGLDDASSSDNSPFMERSLSATLRPGLLRGAVLRMRGQRWSLAIGGFGNDLADEDRRSLPGRSAVARAVWQPLNTRRLDLGFGLSGETRRADTGATARLRSRPETALTPARLVDTRTLQIGDGITTLGADAFLATGPVMVAAEFAQSRVELLDGETPTFTGWTATAGWTLTGEHRNYRVGTGAYSGFEPRHRWGAVELAVRASRLDLEDGSVTGGVETNTGVALNWYWNRNSRLAINYIRVDAQPNRNGIDESPTLLQARFQLAL
ncbi:MAG: porin [Steroidobacteraceae bacterium]